MNESIEQEDTKYTNAELISKLKAVAEVTQSPLTKEKFSNFDAAPPVEVVVDRFGSWNDALELAGLEPVGGGQWNKEEIIDCIREMSDEETAPSTTMLAEDSDAPAISTVQNYFDDWESAVRAAGLEPRRMQYDRDRIIEQINRFADGMIPPEKEEFTERDITPNTSTINNHFDSWEAALDAAGFVYTDEELIDQVRLVGDGDQPPTQFDFNMHPETVTVQMVKDQVGWLQAINQAGFDIRKLEHGATKDKIINQLQTLAEGEVAPSSTEFSEHPYTFSSVTVRNVFDSWEDAVESAGLVSYVEYTKDELLEFIENLVEVTDEGVEIPSYTEFEEHPETPSAATVGTRFGSWNNAIEELGYTPRSQGSGRRKPRVWET